MRLSNREKKPFYSFIYSLGGIIFLLGLIAYILEISKFDVFGSRSWILLIIPLVLFAFLYLMGRPIFEYDSDGEALNFRNSHIIYLLAKKDARDEFPKYKIIKYNIISVLFFKRLYVYILSKKNQVIILKYEISYLNRKQIEDLKFSLNKVVKYNSENRKQDNTVTD
ncbi:MAG TPA: hypothetical protein DD740_10160 [Chryseobacterium sp.]|nr:hypothetical protein [Chryseobacterium sp.]